MLIQSLIISLSRYPITMPCVILVSLFPSQQVKLLYLIVLICLSKEVDLNFYWHHKYLVKNCIKCSEGRVATNMHGHDVMLI